jgi:DNA-binding PadR family transcriptional regulator
MMSDKNVLKREILQYLRDGKLSIGYDIIKAIGKESHNVRNALLRLRRNYLVEAREEDRIHAGPRNRLVLQYTITQKGLKRLDYYSQVKPKRSRTKGVSE